MFRQLLQNLQYQFQQLMKAQQEQQKNFQIPQFLGHDGGQRGVSLEDYISVLKFNESGKQLAVPDFAGRVIIFRKTSNSNIKKHQKLQYCHQFQSHISKFDSLKKQQISGKINDICFLKTQGKYSKILAANAKEIKLWKYFEHDDRVLMKSSGPQLHIPKMCSIQTSYQQRQQKSFYLNSKGSFHSLLVPKNEEYIFAATQSKVLTWNMEKSKQPYIFFDIDNYRTQSAPVIQNFQQCSKAIRAKSIPKKKRSININEQKKISQIEKITSIALHPKNDNVIGISNNKGVIRINDIRFSNFQSVVLSDTNETKKSFFSDMLAPISKIQFLQFGKYIVARDFLTVKIWDLCKPNIPLIKINLHQGLLANLNQMFQKDLFGDCFPLAVSQKDPLICTGFYDDKVHILDWKSGNIDSNTIVNKQFTLNKQEKIKAKETNSNIKNCQVPKLNYEMNIRSIDLHSNSNTIALSHKNCVYIMAKN